MPEIAQEIVMNHGIKTTGLPALARTGFGAEVLRSRSAINHEDFK
jgi:hypothetical protein